MGSPEDKRFGALRTKIDVLNKDLLRALNARAKIAMDLATLKNSIAEDKQQEEVYFYRPEREAEILQEMCVLNKGPLNDSAITTIFREIISACLSLERSHAIAYLGPTGTFTEEAVKLQFGSGVRTIAQRTISDVFAEVEAGSADYGVVPVENSTEGMVTHTLDTFLDSSLLICGEVILPIRHHLMTQANLNNKQIQWVSAHQQALSQCRRWLTESLPTVEQRAVSSNGEAARLASEVVGMAAIASETAAQHYNLHIIKRNIQDRLDNTTRFLILGKQRVDPCGKDKTAIIISVKNQPGALYRLLAFFNKAQTNMTRLDTRPSRTEKWTYHFFIEFEGHVQEPNIEKLLKDLAANSIALKNLGSYPVGRDTNKDT